MSPIIVKHVAPDRAGIPTTSRTGGLPVLQQAITDAAPQGGRLISVTPAGTHVASGTYLCVWEVGAACGCSHPLIAGCDHDDAAPSSGQVGAAVTERYGITSIETEGSPRPEVGLAPSSGRCPDCGSRSNHHRECPQVQRQSWGKQRIADTRRAAAAAIINAALDDTDRNAEEEGEPPDLLTYLDDVARHLLTIVEDGS